MNYFFADKSLIQEKSKNGKNEPKFSLLYNQIIDVMMRVKKSDVYSQYMSGSEFRKNFKKQFDPHEMHDS